MKVLLEMKNILNQDQVVPKQFESRYLSWVFRSGLWAIFLLLSPKLNAQPWSKLQFEHYTSEDGLPSNELNLTIQDQLGYIWIGTSKGLCKFDGTTWTSYSSVLGNEKSITCTNTISIYSDSKQRIWAGTKNMGVNVLNRQSGKFKNYSYSVKDTTTLAGLLVSDIFEDIKGRIWVCANGVNLFDEKTSTFSRHSVPQSISLNTKTKGWANTFRFIKNDPDDPHWVWLYSSFGLCKFNTTTFESETYYPHTSEIATRQAIMDGTTIWMTNYGLGLYAFDIHSKTFTLYQCDPGKSNTLSCQLSASILELDNRYLLLSGYNYHLFMFDRKSKTFIPPDPSWKSNTYNDPEGILMKDKENRIWISTFGSGLYVQQQQFSNFIKYPLQGEIQDICEYNNHLYACNTDGRLFQINTNTQQTELTFDLKNELGEKTKPKKFHIDHQNRLWILSRNELHYYSSTTGRVQAWNPSFFTRESATFNYFWDITSDSISGRTWLSSQSDGLIGFGPNPTDIFRFSKDIKNPNYIEHSYSIGSLLTDRQQNIWGSSGAGYFKYNTHSQITSNSPSPIQSSLNNQPFMGQHLFCQGPIGSIWINSGHSRIAKVIDTKNLSLPVEEIVLNQFNLDDPINDIIADKSGDIWISSTHGLTRINPKNGNVNQYGIQFGIDEVNGLGLTAKGELLASTEGGFYQFQPSDIPRFQLIPTPLIEIFRVFDIPFTIPNVPNPLVHLTYKQNFFSFDFSAFDYSGRSKKEFAYQLEGVNEDWILAGDRKYAAYTNIDGGMYRFKLKVRREFGPWSKPTILSIKIIPPFWKTAWFWVLITLCCAGLSYLGYAYRVAQIKKEEKLKTAFFQQLAEVEMKALRAQMNPHFLFNSLNAIKYYVLKRNKEKAAEYLTDFARLIRLVLNNSSQPIISLEKELEALELYIRIERLRFDEKFDYQLKIDPTIDLTAIAIPPLLIQPFVENAIWHGLMHKKEDRGMLLISIQKSDLEIEIIIEDNGIGRQRAEEVKSKSAKHQKSFGLNITRDRMAISKLINNLDITTEIQDLINNDKQPLGTRIIVRMKSSISNFNITKQRNLKP